MLNYLISNNIIRTLYPFFLTVNLLVIVPNLTLSSQSLVFSFILRFFSRNQSTPAAKYACSLNDATKLALKYI